MENNQPTLNKKAFICPHCNAFSAMKWQQPCINTTHGRYDAPIKLAECHQCERASVWLNGKYNYPIKLLYPSIITAPLPKPDLPESCKKDYLEAREIATLSPKGAAALLRLCVQNLIIHLGGTGKNINEDIRALVAKGLNPQIQQALDIVRVIGNNAVHPGEINIDDKQETVSALFGLINLIVDSQITQPKQVSALFDSLPDGAKEAIAKRDKTP
ncbi:TPA: DUF4145 domain-containing protein [Photobacterium damselae]